MNDAGYKGSATQPRRPASTAAGRGVPMIVALLTVTVLWGCVRPSQPASVDVNVEATVNSAVESTDSATVATAFAVAVEHAVEATVHARVAVSVTSTQAAAPMVPTPVPSPTPMATPPTRTPTVTPTPRVEQLPFDQARSLAASITYDDLFRNNERHVGKLVGFAGEIVQVLDGGGGKYQLRVNVTNTGFIWVDTVFLRYTGPRLLEDDVIEFVGNVTGLLTYETVLGAKVTIPDIEAVNVRLVAKGAATPTPVPTPTPTASPSPASTPVLGLSRTRPASLGARVLLSGGNREVAVSVLEVLRGEAAWDQIRSASSLNDPPPTGSEYLLVRVRIEYVKAPNPDDRIVAAWADWDAVSSTGTVYEPPRVIKPRLLAQLYQGGRAEGWVAAQVALVDTDPLMSTRGFQDGRAFAWFRTR